MRNFSKLFALVLLLSLGISLGFGWGNATHVYFSNCLGVKFGPLNQNEIYGSVLPDLFNLEPSAAGLADAFHFNTDLMMDLYLAAPSREAKAAVYGFITHNNVWGADFTAHDNGITVGNKGWVIYYADKLAPRMKLYLVSLFTNIGVPAGDAEGIAGLLAPAMAHDLVETAVDVLVKRSMDPLIGERLYRAAKVRSADVPEVFASALAGYIPRDRFLDGEKEYREGMMMYGQLFMLPEATLIQELGNLSAGVAAGYIKANTNLDVTVDPAKVVEYLTMAIDLVKPHYRLELYATLINLEKEMAKHRIASAGPVFALFREDVVEGELEQVDLPAQRPTAIVLDQNYPNPFNPTTTISYHLPADGHVSLKVYNTIGQEVATLVDESVAAGVHQATWNASSVPSGVYIYRLNTGSFLETKRMMLVK